MFGCCFFLAHQYDELSRPKPHSGSFQVCFFFFCMESTDPDQKTKQTEQGCTVLKSWSLQHCLKQ